MTHDRPSPQNAFIGWGFERKIANRSTDITFLHWSPKHDTATTLRPTAREQKFLESVEEGRYEREIISGLGPFFHEKAPEDMLNFYSKDEVTTSKRSRAPSVTLKARMPVKITRHYYELARTSAAIQRIVKADPAETWIWRARRIPATRWTTAPSRACCTSTRWDSCMSSRPARPIAASAIAKN
jgi:hypothetical protein